MAYPNGCAISRTAQRAKAARESCEGMISFGHLSFATLHLPRNDIPHGRFNQMRTTCEGGEGVQSSCPSVDPMPLKFMPLLAVIFPAGAVTKPLNSQDPGCIMVAGDLSLCNQLRLRELGSSSLIRSALQVKGIGSMV